MRLAVVISTLSILTLGVVACSHTGKNNTSTSTRYRTKPVCDGATRRDDWDMFRAVFTEELSSNEVEVIGELEQQYLEYTALKIHYPDDKQGPEIDKYGASLRRKKQALEQLRDTLSPYAQSTTPSVVLMSHYRSGEAYEQLAVEIENTRVPKGSTETEKDAFCASLFSSTTGLRDIARNYYQQCVQAAQRLDDKGSWTRQCKRKLGTIALPIRQ